MLHLHQDAEAGFPACRLWRGRVVGGRAWWLLVAGCSGTLRAGKRAGMVEGLQCQQAGSFASMLEWLGQGSAP